MNDGRVEMDREFERFYVIMGEERERERERDMKARCT